MIHIDCEFYGATLFSNIFAIGIDNQMTRVASAPQHLHIKTKIKGHGE